MGMDFNIKPVGGSVAAPITEHAPDAARAGVKTQLPPDKTITAMGASIAAQNNPQADSEEITRQVVIDRAAAEVVYRVVDNRTALVVRQFPDEARLRARAYMRAFDIARQERANRHTDIRA